MIFMTPSPVLVLALSLMASAALAQAPMSTAPAPDTAPSAQGAASPPQDLDQPPSRQTDAAQWGRDVLARARGELPPSTEERAQLDPDFAGSAAKTGCVRNPDRAPHGSAGVAVGTGGYRAADIYVTQPVGDCGQISIGISTSRGGRHFGPGHYGPY